MSEVSDTFRARARATWASGNWDGFAELLRPVGALVLDRIGLVPGLTLLDVGTGSGGNVAIPAAQRGVEVVGADVTPELFDHARRRAAQCRSRISRHRALRGEEQGAEPRRVGVRRGYGALGH